MLITYRRTGGVVALLAVAAIAVAAAIMVAAVAATVLIGSVAVAAGALLVRAVRPARWFRRHAVPPATPWPQETIEATVIERQR